jgi:hypothetical protein
LVVQEVALADRLLLICGHRVLPWESLVHCSQFLQETRAWTLLKKHAGVFRSVDDHLRSNRWRPPIRFGQQLSALLDARETISQNKLAPEDLLFLGWQFDATEVKDKFYAMLGLAKARLDEFAAPAQLPLVNYEQSIKEVALAFTTYHVKCSRGLKILSSVEDGTYRVNKELPSWVPDLEARLLPLPLETDILDDKVSSPWNACGSREDVKEPVIDENILIVQGYQIDVVEKVAMPFNTLVENGQWSDLFDLLEPLTDKQISGMTFDEAFWRTLIATTDPPLGKHAASTMGLESEFSEWIISLLDSIPGDPVRDSEEEMTARMMLSAYKLDDRKFDIMTFGKEAFGPNNEYIIDEFRLQSMLQEPSTQLMLDSVNKFEAECESSRGGNVNDLSKQLENSINRLWKSNPTGVFSSPARIRETLSAINRLKVDSPGRKEIQERIDRFNAAIGKRLDSRRMFVTQEYRLGMGPQSLEEGHEIWVLEGAKVPFVLRRLDGGNFGLVGEAFVFGTMHGEAVKSVGEDGFCEVRLE